MGERPAPKDAADLEKTQGGEMGGRGEDRLEACFTLEHGVEARVPAEHRLEACVTLGDGVDALAEDGVDAGGAFALKALDRSAFIRKTRRNLPHWRQDGCMYFVTFRLGDALPQSLLRDWREEGELWLKLNPRPWTPRVAAEYSRRFQGPVEQWLDAGHGSCALRAPAPRAIVADALRHFDGERYALDAFVVMPNHVHALVVAKGEECDTGFQPVQGAATPPPRAKGDGGQRTARRTGWKPVSLCSLSGVLHSWKSFTSLRVNRLLGRTGRFWMDENFDYIVRSEAQWGHFRAYIRENPAKARLREGEWTWWERERESDTGFQPVPSAGTVAGREKMDRGTDGVTDAGGKSGASAQGTQAGSLCHISPP